MKVNNINKLKNEGLVTNELLILISNLTLEDLIAIKIELSCSLLNNRLYGLDIWKRMSYITKEALLRVVKENTSSKTEAARFLGITMENYKIFLKKFNIE